MRRRLAFGIALYFVLGAGLHWIILPEAPIPQHLHPRAGDQLENARARERIRFLKTGNRSVIEVSLAPGGGVPVAHAHPQTRETFRIMHGRIEANVGGKRRILTSGDEVTVAPGVGHIVRNIGQADALLEVTMEPTKLMNLALVQTHGYLSHAASPPSRSDQFLQLLRFADRYDVFLAELPIWLQELGILALAPTARILGYRGFYPGYAMGAQPALTPQQSDSTNRRSAEP